MVPFPGSTPLSPVDLAQFGCHMIAEVENRAVQSIETGTLVFHRERGLSVSVCCGLWFMRVFAVFNR